MDKPTDELNQCPQCFTMKHTPKDTPCAGCKGDKPISDERLLRYTTNRLARMLTELVGTSETASMAIIRKELEYFIAAVRETPKPEPRKLSKKELL